MMKKFFTFCCLLSISLFAGTIQNDAQFQDALTKIGASNKLVLMIYTADDCPECAYMKQKVFHDQAVQQYMNQNFVLIEKNVHKSELPDEYDFFGIPTLFVIDKSGTRQETIIGSKRSEAFLTELRRIKGLE